MADEPAAAAEPTAEPAAEPEAERRSKVLDPRLNDIRHKQGAERDASLEAAFYQELMRPPIEIEPDYVRPSGVSSIPPGWKPNPLGGFLANNNDGDEN